MLNTMTGVSSSCGACKFLRRRCSEECIFAPYFCYEQAATHFAAVHKVFGASNVSKLLSHLPVHTRSDAAITVSYEALARMQDPIYGCVSHIFALQQQVACLAEEIEIIEKQMADVGINVIPCESSNPYFPVEVDMRSNVISMNEEWCSHMELQYPDEILEAYLNSSLIDRLVEDYYVHEQLSQDYNLQPLWIKYAAADQY